MIKVDPIIAVSNVENSSLWYQKLLGCKSIHGGSTFDILVDENGDVILNLHAWGEHEHPTLTKPITPPGNGLILYLRTPKLEAIRKNAENADYTIENDIHTNPNSGLKEFSLRDLDGYYLIVSEYHTYGV